MIQFDYEAEGLPAETLETIAEVVLTVHNDMRYTLVEAAIETGRELQEAKKVFKTEKQKGDTWAKWCTRRLQMSASNADKAIRVVSVLGKKDLQHLAGLPITSLYKLCREGTSTETRNKILAIAKKTYLNARDVDQLLGDEPATEETRSIHSAPESREEMKAWLEQKALKPLDRKLNGSPVKEELPSVLHELADELSAA